MLEDDERWRMRQDLLEAMAAGFGGPALAPMPGVLMETFEIAAMRRHQERTPSDEMPIDATKALTTNQNRSGMLAKLLGPFRATAGVGGWVKSGFGGRRLPA